MGIDSKVEPHLEDRDRQPLRWRSGYITVLSVAPGWVRSGAWIRDPTAFRDLVEISRRTFLQPFSFSHRRTEQGETMPRPQIDYSVYLVTGRELLPPGKVSCTVDSS